MNLYPILKLGRVGELISEAGGSEEQVKQLKVQFFP